MQSTADGAPEPGQTPAPPQAAAALPAPPPLAASGTGGGFPAGHAGGGPARASGAAAAVRPQGAAGAGASATRQPQAAQAARGVAVARAVQPAAAGAGGVATGGMGGSRQPDFVREKRGPGRKVFARELENMMYGFGDHESPLPESVEVMDDIVCDFISNLSKSMVALSEKRGKGAKMSIEDILFIVRKHPKMYFRAKELLKKEKEITQARKTHSDKGMEKDLLGT